GTREPNHHGQEDNGPGEPLKPCVLDRKQRQRKAETHQDRGQHERVLGRERERAPEARVVPYSPIVREAYDLTAAEQRSVGQGNGGELAERDQDEDRDEEQSWRDEEPAVPLRKRSRPTHRCGRRLLLACDVLHLFAALFDRAVD